ncbi:MAG: Bifunctional thiamine biosynthesis protein ThiDN [Candidatus Heimdallarchaeota archaeon LC_2]|nr:MAG: Bifunctional thiamine biosynthesis protein ThiDN [Candidatus Heimdallarchaeota archaeon LC_2]
MRFPCEIISEPFLARLRSDAAKYLYKKGYSQQSIADLLQVSQPIVSSYLKRKHNTNSEIPEIILREAQQIGTQIGEILDTQGNEGIPQSISIACQSCKKLRQGGGTCYYHKLLNPHLEENCTRCLTSEKLIVLQIDRENIINQLQLIFKNLINTTKYNYLIPEIGLQIVIGTSDMKSQDDIAGFPGRIIKRKTGLPSTEIPIFSTSQTMSKLLLITRKYFPNISGLAGIKTTEWLIEKLQETGISYFEYQGFDKNYENHMIELRENNDFPPINKPFVVVDQGSIGFEAISYVFAEKPNDLTKVFDLLLL